MTLIKAATLQKKLQKIDAQLEKLKTERELTHKAWNATDCYELTDTPGNLKNAMNHQKVLQDAVQNDQWLQGYICAVAQLSNHSDPLDSYVLDILGAGCPRVETAIKAGADESDIETLRPAWEELERKRR